MIVYLWVWKYYNVTLSETETGAAAWAEFIFLNEKTGLYFPTLLLLEEK